MNALGACGWVSLSAFPSVRQTSVSVSETEMYLERKQLLQYPKGYCNETPISMALPLDIFPTHMLSWDSRSIVSDCILQGMSP